MLSKNVGLYPARLMSPEDVKLALQSRNDVPMFLQNRWYLCGDISEELYELLQNSRVEKNYRITAFTSSDDTIYVAFCLQLEQNQIRFLMSLSDKNAANFITQVGAAGLSLSLGRNCSVETSLIEFKFSLKSIEPLVELARQVKKLDGMAILEELKFAVKDALKNDFIPSAIPHCQVNQVCLNVVMPEMPTQKNSYH